MFNSDGEIESEIELEAEALMMSSFSEGAKLISSPTIGIVTNTINSSAMHRPTIYSSAAGHDSDDNQGNGFPTHIASSIPDEKRAILNANKTTCYVWLLSSFAAIGGFLFGYDTGVISGAMLLLRNEFSLSSIWQELIVSVTTAAAFISSLIGGYLNDAYGRKAVTLISSFVFTAGALVLAAAQNVAMLVLGRLILGIGIGFASMTVPVYIAESAPAYLRGSLVTVNVLFITGGQFVASLIDGVFSYVKPNGWRYMLGLAGVPSFIQFCGFFFVPESPRWLIKKGRDIEARAVLVKLRGTQSVEVEMNDIKQSINLETENNDYFIYRRIWRTGPVRRAVIVGCGLQLFQQLSGINTVMYYSATIIKMAGVSDEHKAIWLSALTSGINFVFTLVGMWLVEKVGRKKLIMASLLGATCSLMVSAIAFQLIAYNSPSVSDLDPELQNSTCSQYRWCESCIQDNNCGFCYTESAGVMNSSCLAAGDSGTSHSISGACENETVPNGFLWAYDYCPTPYSWMAILGLALYLMFFAPGMGPMPWTINSEIYPLWARSMGNSLSAATNWISNFIISMTFLTLTEEITTYGTYWLLVGIAILGLIFIRVYLPETKGRKLEEIEDLFSEPWNHCCRTEQSHNEYSSLESSTSS